MSTQTAVEEKVGQWIRSCHPYQYKSGKWGKVVAVVPARDMDMWLVHWSDGDSDVWNPEDPDAGYEFDKRTAKPVGS